MPFTIIGGSEHSAAEKKCENIHNTFPSVELFVVFFWGGGGGRGGGVM